MSVDLREKIKQAICRPCGADKNNACEDVKELGHCFLDNMNVLALLDNYMEKWQQIVEHIENRPKRHIEEIKTNEASMDSLVIPSTHDYDEWFEVLEVKVAELKKEEVEN